MTSGIAIALTVYAIYSKTDFTEKGGLLFAASISLMLFGIFSGIFYKSCPILYIFFCLIGVILYSMYLIYDI